MVAFDPNYPTVQASATVTIDVERNINPPELTSSTYRATVSDTAKLGTVVVNQINATDRDGDVLSYRLTGSSQCQQYFYMDSATGKVSLKHLLRGVNINQLLCTVEVTDNAYPTPRTDNAQLVIDVTGMAPPTFNPVQYNANEQETSPVNKTVQTVSATKPSPTVSFHANMRTGSRMTKS